VRLGGSDAFGDLADDASASSAGNLLLDRPDAEVGGGRERLDLVDDALWRAGPTKMPAARPSRPHAGGNALADERGLQFGHGADDGERRPAHRTVSVNLVLHADEAHPKVVELLQCYEQC